MAKVKILGDVFQIKSKLTVTAMEKVKRYKPEILKLKDKEGNEYFEVAVGETPSISKYGICFSDVDTEGNLFITVNSTGLVTAESVVENFAGIIMNLKFVEEAVKHAADDVSDMESRVLASIETLS